MTMTGEAKRRLRGIALKALQRNHELQGGRIDHITLWSMLRSFTPDTWKNQVKWLLQDLEGRGYVEYQRERNEELQEEYFVKIEITPKGADVAEGINKDTAVEV